MAKKHAVKEEVTEAASPGVEDSSVEAESNGESAGLYQDVQEEQLHGACQRLSAIGEPTRLTILYALGQAPRTVTDLVGVCQMAQANVSTHLQKLVYTQLAYSTGRGKTHLYNLTKLGKVALDSVHNGITKHVIPFDPTKI